MLVSRDEQSCLVVSYGEIKACIESAFGCVRTTTTTIFADPLIFDSRELSMSTAVR